MSTKKIIKILSALLIMILVISCQLSVFADYGNVSVEAERSNLGDNIMSAGAKVYGVFQVAGIIVATIMLIVLAIKYLTSSPQDKADVKKSAFIYVFGAILLYAASGVMGIIKSAAGLFNT